MFANRTIGVSGVASNYKGEVSHVVRYPDSRFDWRGRFVHCADRPGRPASPDNRQRGCRMGGWQDSGVFILPFHRGRAAENAGRELRRCNCGSGERPPASNRYRGKPLRQHLDYRDGLFCRGRSRHGCSLHAGWGSRVYRAAPGTWCTGRCPGSRLGLSASRMSSLGPKADPGLPPLPAISLSRSRWSQSNPPC